ncbi:MAG: HAD-IIIA family hydrolase [Nitrospirae bacterium]|nr:HAD-IIIA family hydrolase [Nitrospirota bacterium]
MTLPNASIPKKPLSSVQKRKILQSIRVFGTDVDGVLTDGGMYIGNSGEEIKRFHVHDGMGITCLRNAGILIVILTQENSKIVAARGKKLKISEIHQGVMNKLKRLQEIIQPYGFTLENVAYMGDDLNDIPTLQAVGFSATPADGRKEAKLASHYICRCKGGEGAVREVADMIVAAQVRPSATL